MKNNSFLKSISWTWVVIGLLFVGILYYIVSNTLHEKNIVPQICTNKTCFTVEIARTPDEQHLWLMNRESMSENHGMIFVFPKSDFHDFWMKNTLLPLDMIRMDAQGKVVRILTAQPCTVDPCMIYKPEVFANYVLEINAGIAAKYGIVEWTMMKLRNIQ